MNFATLTLLFFVYHSEAALKQSMEAYFHHRIKTSNSEFISCFFSLLTLYLIIWSLYLYLNNSFSLSHHSELIYCNFDFFLTILSVRETPQSLQSPQSSAPTITRSQSPDYWFPAPATAHQAPPYQGSLHTRSTSGLLFTTWLTNATNLCVRTFQFPSFLQRSFRPSSDTLLWLIYKKRDSLYLARRTKDYLQRSRHV